MNRCMNYQNQMMNSCGRSMQRGDSFRPMQRSENCRQEQRQESCRPMQRPDSCRKEQHQESRRHMQESSNPMPCMTEPEPCKKENCLDKPKYSRSQMLQYINEVSFAVNDILLYLDTHPCDCKAMEFYRKNVEKRKAALCDFAKYYGPLTVDTADEAHSENWEWVMQPWPWEGREC